MTNHPITPPPELIEKWHSTSPLDRSVTVATQAARWGADQELEACCGFIGCTHSVTWSSKLRDARRPQPLSPAEEALQALDRVPGPGADPAYLRTWAAREAASLVETVRRALKQLDD